MVELPFRQWDEEVLRDVEELMEKQNVSVMLAHIERFYAYQKRKKIWKWGKFHQDYQTLQ